MGGARSGGASQAAKGPGAAAKRSKPSTAKANPAGGGKGSAASPVNKVKPVDPQAAAATALAGLKSDLKTYLSDFERYHGARRGMSKSQKSSELEKFSARLDTLLTRASQLDTKDTTLLSEVQCEVGTLEWFSDNPRKARRNWRKALSLNPRNVLASDWLSQTEGAELKE
jgi:hypothetical protein